MEYLAVTPLKKTMAGKTKYQNWLPFNVSSNGAKINEVPETRISGFQFTAAIEKKKKAKPDPGFRGLKSARSSEFKSSDSQSSEFRVRSSELHKYIVAYYSVFYTPEFFTETNAVLYTGAGGL